MAFGDAVQQIKDRLNIIDVISPYVELHKAGRHFKGKSPFTNEKTPSFFVSPERGMYYCFSTSQGGDIFKFIEVMEGVDFKTALKILADKAGIELVPENPQKRTEREQLYAILETATKYFESKLLDSTEAQAYLTKRGVLAETIAKWRIGFAPGPPQAGWRELRQHLASLGFSDNLMLKAGLIKTTETGKEPFDVFRDRIMFPLRDQNGKVVAFSGRILSKDTEAPKYVNSPETELFHKSDLLYGYDLAKHGIRNLNFWLIVEGQFDVVMSHQAGYTNTVAVSGTALTMHHVQILERLSSKIVLALDADKAGLAAMKRAADLMLRRGIDVKVASLPDGTDPADLASTDVKALKQAVGKAKHVIEFLLNHLKSTITDERTFKLRVRDEVIPYVPLIPNKIDQEHFEGLIAESLASTKEAVHFEVNRITETRLVDKSAGVLTTLNNKEVIATPLRGETVLMQTVAYYEVTDVKTRALIEKIFQEVVGEGIAEVKDRLDIDQLNKINFQLEQVYEKMTPRSQQEEIIHVLNQLRQQTIKDRLSLAKKELEDPGIIQSEIMTKILNLQKQLQLENYSLDLFAD